MTWPVGTSPRAREALRARVEADRQALIVGLQRMAAPLRSLQALPAQIREHLRVLPLLVAAVLCLWWLRRPAALRTQRCIGSVPAPDVGRPVVSAMPALAAAGGGAHWSGWIQRFIEVWRLVLQIRELLRLHAALRDRPQPAAIAAGRSGSPSAAASSQPTR